MTDDFLRRPKAVGGVPQVKNIEELSEWLKKNSDEERPMADRKGDPSKKPADCTGNSRCPHVEFNQGWETETYDCRVCGAYWKLYYEDMA